MERSAAVLYPGEMGCAVARILVGEGWSLCTHLWGPSLAVRAAAEATGIADLGSLDQVLAAVDLVISLVPPAVAVETAELVAGAARRSGRQPLYLDANSVAPATVADVAAAAAAGDLDCVDGSFIGSAADLGARTRLYLSGSRASELVDVLPLAFQETDLGPQAGAASAFKLAFAGFNKGLVALFLEVMGAGAVAGRPDELLRCLRDFYPGTVETLERLLPSYPLHAARRAEEMDELARWLSSEGRDPALAGAAGDVLRRAAARGLDGTRRWTFAEALAALAIAPPNDDDAAAKP